MNILKEGKYQGLELNPTAKGSDGFYINHIEVIYALLKLAKCMYTKPLCAHLTIDNPSPGTLNRIHKELSRWHKLEHPGQATKPLHPLYFACIETRPRNKRRHLHLMVVFQATEDSSYSLKTLKRRLRKLSISERVKINLRSDLNRAPVLNQVTGVYETTYTGRIRRIGSAYYHNLAVEFADAFKRFSYLAKVFTKDASQKRGTSYGHSRLSPTSDPLEPLTK